MQPVIEQDFYHIQTSHPHSQEVWQIGKMIEIGLSLNPYEQGVYHSPLNYHPSMADTEFNQNFKVIQEAIPQLRSWLEQRDYTTIAQNQKQLYCKRIITTYFQEKW